MRFWLLCFGLLLTAAALKAQTNDSIYVRESDSFSIVVPEAYQHSVNKAVRYSAFLPGLGQAYNRKYWKIPIIYGLGGYTVYTALQNQKEYLRHRDAYRLRVDDNAATVDEFDGIQSNQELRLNRDFFRQSRDLNWILTLGVYALNMVDAAVDAHLFHFNVSDDLSLRLLRDAPQYNLATGHWQFPMATLTLKL
jgi:hypothetical protein